jgi:hypothetical protein
MYRLMLRAAVPVVLAMLACSSTAAAHCFVGARFFPATLVTDDPCVADELSLPTVSVFHNGDDPSAKEIDISGEYSKRITDTFGISVGSTWTHLAPPGGPNASGFQNLDTTFKFQFLTDAPHELVMATSIVVEWGNTGAAGVGAESFSTVVPTVYIGKGFGDLPDEAGWLRPFGVTAQVGYAIPTSSSTITFDPDSGLPIVDFHPQFLRYSGSLQYSMPYLKSNVVDLGLPDFINHLIPIVEAQFQTPVANNTNTGIGTTGTINPGIIYVSNYFQLGLEAIIPINRASGTTVGAVAQLHIYLDDLFPTSIGRPLFTTGPTSAGRPIFGN